MPRVSGVLVQSGSHFLTLGRSPRQQFRPDRFIDSRSKVPAAVLVNTMRVSDCMGAYFAHGRRAGKCVQSSGFGMSLSNLPHMPMWFQASICGK